MGVALRKFHQTLSRSRLVPSGVSFYKLLRLCFHANFVFYTQWWWWITRTCSIFFFRYRSIITFNVKRVRLVLLTYGITMSHWVREREGGHMVSDAVWYWPDPTSQDKQDPDLKQTKTPDPTESETLEGIKIVVSTLLAMKIVQYSV